MSLNFSPQPMVYGIFTCFLKRRILLCGFVLVSFITTGQSYEKALTGTWQFKADFYGEGLQKKWYADLTSPWDSVMVPASWQQFLPYQQFEGMGWYKKGFTLPNSLKGRDTFITFQQLLPNAIVWINGEKAAPQWVGMQAILDLAKFKLHYGKPNFLVIAMNSISDSPLIAEQKGILGKVYLEVKEEIYFSELTAVSKLETGGKSAKAFLEGIIKNTGSTMVDASVHSFLVTPQKDTTQLQTLQLPLPAKQATTFSLPKIPLQKAELWSYTTPNVYSITHYLVVEGDTLQHKLNTIGFSNITADLEQIELNSMLFKGVGSVPKIPYVSLQENVLQRALLSVKQQGASMVPIPLAMLSDELVQYAAELGLLVMVTIPKGTIAAFKQKTEWLKMLLQHYKNYPNILGWAFADTIDSQLTRKVKSINSSVSLIQRIRIDEAEATDNYFANVLLLEGERFNPEQVAIWAERSTQTPLLFWEKAEVTHPNFSLENYAKVLPDNFAGGFFGTTSAKEHEQTQYNTTLPLRRFRFIDSLVVTHSGQLKPRKRIKTLIEVKPKRTWGIPHTQLDNHYLLWYATNFKGEIIEGDFLPLRKINMGDKSFIATFSWQVPKPLPFQLVFQVVSPTFEPVYSDAFFLEGGKTQPNPKSEVLFHTVLPFEHFSYVKPKPFLSSPRWEVELSQESSKSLSTVLRLNEAQEGFYIKNLAAFNPPKLRLRSLEKTEVGTSPWQEVRIMKVAEEQMPLPSIKTIIRTDNKAIIVVKDTQHADFLVEYKANRSPNWRATSIIRNGTLILIDKLSTRSRYTFWLKVFPRNGEPPFIADEQLEN